MKEEYDIDVMIPANDLLKLLSEYWNLLIKEKEIKMAGSVAVVKGMVEKIIKEKIEEAIKT